MESTRPRGGRRKGRAGRARGQKTGGMLASLHGRNIILDQRSPTSSPADETETGPEVAETLGLKMASSCNISPRENAEDKENNCRCFTASPAGKTAASPNDEVNANTPPLTSVKMGLDNGSRSLFSPLSPGTPARESSDGIESDRSVTDSDEEKSQLSDATDACATDASNPRDDSPRDKCFEEASDASSLYDEGEESDCDEDYCMESDDDSLEFDEESEENDKQRGRRRKNKAQKTQLSNASKVVKTVENDATSNDGSTCSEGDGRDDSHDLSTLGSKPECDSETTNDESPRRHLKGCRTKLSDKLEGVGTRDETEPNQQDPPKMGREFDWGVYSHLKGENADSNVVSHEARPVLKSRTKRQSRRKAVSKSADGDNFMANAKAAAKSKSTESEKIVLPEEEDDGDFGSPEMSRSENSAASSVSETIEDEQDGSVKKVISPNKTVTADSDVPSQIPSESDLFKVVDDLFNDADTDTVTVRDVVKSVGIHFGLQKIDKVMKACIKGRLTDLIHGDVTPEADGRSTEKSERAHNGPGEIDPGTVEESLGDFGGATDFSIDASEVEIDDENDAGTGMLSLSPSGAVPLDGSGASSPLDAQVVSPREQEEISADEAGTTVITITGSTQEQTCQQQPGVESSSNAEATYTPEPAKDPSKQQHSDTVGLESVDEDSVVSGSSSLFQNLSPDISVRSSASLLSGSIQSMSLSTSLKDTKSCIVVKGKWSLGSEIGKGSFGRVYMGMNGVSGNFMAVKILQIPNDNRRAIIDDLQREIDLMKTLKHPNIVRYLGAEVDRSRNILHIFQEWAPGGSVSSLLRQFGGPFTTAVVRSYTSQILAGLQYLHSHGIIHRDIKGGNILVSSDGSIKVADFGASKRVEVLSDEPDEMEMTMRGTPYFMAIEVFEERYGAKADIWSVGGVIYQMVTGSPPWKNIGFKSPMSLFRHLKSHDRPPELPHLSQCSDSERRQLLSILKRCFQRDPSLRPSASDLQHDPFLTCTASSSPVPSSPDPMGALFIKSPVALKRPVSPLIKIPEEHATLESAMSDSLCYSMTLAGPLVLAKDDKRTSKYDMSDWPQWAIDKEREEKSTFIGQQPNPYS